MTDMLLGLPAPTLLTGLYGLRVPEFRPTWPFVRGRFRQLLANLELTEWQQQDAVTKARNVLVCLNRAYWGYGSPERNHRLVGSWGKGTRVRPPRDLDLLFELPFSVLERFRNHAGNGPSQLLQELRSTLAVTFPGTALRGDGQVVIIPFNTCPIEVVPAFLAGTQYLVPDTNDGGRWKPFDPRGEEAALDGMDHGRNGSARKLVRVLKQWRRHCNVPLKSIHLEAVVRETLAVVPYASDCEYWFDWLVRDCLAHLVSRAGGTFMLPGTYEVIAFGDAWLGRARSAHRVACLACDHERASQDMLAGEQWQELFGSMVPLRVT